MLFDDIEERHVTDFGIAITDLAKSVLGWEAKVGIEEGLRRTFIWVKEDMDRQGAAPAVEELPFISQMSPWFDDAEANAVSNYMRSGAYLTEFKQTAEFERMLEEYIGCKHAMAFNNGTVSLTVALLAVDLGPWVLVSLPISLLHNPFREQAVHIVPVSVSTTMLAGGAILERASM